MKIAVPRWSWVIISGLFLTILAASFWRRAAQTESEGVLVATKEGFVRGHRNGEAVVWKGIPYALPPIGELRWRSPRPASKWTGTRNADSFGPACPQTVRRGAVTATSEDCLTLNIWAPPRLETSSRVPVIVLIHGGYFMRGAASLRNSGSDLYDGAWLSTNGHAVVVTLNYRIGALGFLAHPDLAEEDDGNGNFGLLDQIAALRWVKANIDAFGGDPSRVLLFGQSAGASAVGALLAAPMADSMFTSAVLSSGRVWAHPKFIAQANGTDFAERVGCGELHPLTCLRKMEADLLAAAGDINFKRPHDAWGPVVDGRTIPMEPLESIRAGKSHEVPIMIGTTSNEFGNLIDEFVGAAEDEKELSKFLDARLGNRDGRESAYPPGEYKTLRDELIAVMSDQNYVCPSEELAGSLAMTQSQPVFRYVFSHAVRHGSLARLGAAHGLDLRMIFHNLTPRVAELDTDEELLSSVMIRSVAAFAGSGSPAQGVAMRWTAYTVENRSLLRFDTPISESHDERARQCRYWLDTPDSNALPSRTRAGKTPEE